MINYALIDLFKQDSVKKDLIITDGANVNLSNVDIYMESFELTEMVCGEEQLVFGSCNAACLKFTTSYLGDLKGKVLTVSVVLDDNTNNPFQFGKYKVIEDTLSADRTKKDIVAYDALYDIINANVIDWYNTLLPNPNSTKTLKQFRDSFFSNFGITQETITLDNDSLTITKTVGGKTLSGADVIKAICATNGCFGRINRSGNFEYFYLKPIGHGLFPSLTLYPSSTLKPSWHKNATEIGENGKYIKAKYEDYEVSKITKLIIRDSDDEQIIAVGSGSNTYIMGNNLLLYEKTSSQLSAVATNILNRIKDIYYTPCEIELKGNPCYEIGDGFIIRLVDGTEFVSFILNRTYKGIQAQRDTFTSEGLEEREEDLNSTDSQLYQIRGKSNKLERNLDYTISTLTNESLDPQQNPLALRSYIKQTADEVETKVSKTSPTGQTSFSWSMTDSQMEWKANNSQIMLLNSSGLKITGEVNAITGIIGGWHIDQSGIYIEYTTGGVHTKVVQQSDGTHVCYDLTKQPGQAGYVKWALQSNGNVQISGDCTISGNATIAGYATAASVSAVDAKFNNLNADNITSGTISASRIAAGSITGSKLAAGTISGDKISADAFSGNTFTGSSFNVGTLSSTNGFIWLSGFKYTPVQYNGDLYLLRKTST